MAVQERDDKNQIVVEPGAGFGLEAGSPSPWRGRAYFGGTGDNVFHAVVSPIFAYLRRSRSLDAEYRRMQARASGQTR